MSNSKFLFVWILKNIENYLKGLFMNLSPVSFGSTMVFTINDGKPKASVPALVKTAFKNNPELEDYILSDTFKYTEEKIDGTVHNAAPNFAEFLDKKYKELLPKGSNKVILTEAEFYVNPKETQKRYFITASNNEQESQIHKILSQGITLFSAKFGYKK